MDATIKFCRETNFTGRNGYFKASGLLVTGYDQHGNVMLTPITSKGKEARCDIEVPVQDIPQLIKQLQKFL
jgi:predicted Rdx family selenoprotein